MAWKSDLPGSPVVMCHQSNSTGAAFASDGEASDDAAAEAAVDGAAADGAAADGAPVAGVPDEHALITNAVVARTPNMRQRVDTDRPPPGAGRPRARSSAPSGVSNVCCDETFGPVAYRFRAEP